MTNATRTPMIEESRIVERGDAMAVRTEITLGAGELTIAGGATALLEADFRYNVPSWRPELDYAMRDGQGHLTLRQPSGDASGVRNARQQWDLRFAAGVPLDLQVKVGAATGSLVVGDLDLRNLTIETGAGNLTLDLSGAHSPLAVTLNGGVINATLGLPTAVPTQVAIHAPLANIDAPGLRQSGRTYTNAVAATPDGGVTVTISGGVASIALTLGSLLRRPGDGEQR